MKVTFPPWGNYTIAFEALFQKLGVEVIPPPKINSKVIEEGVKISPEMYCFPLKTNVGSYLDAIRRGAEVIVMVTSCTGSCRLRYYGDVQKKVLEEAGHKVDFIIFDQNPFDLYSKIKEISGASFWQIIKALLFSYQKLKIIEWLEKKAWYLRAREKKKGETDEIFEDALRRLREIQEFKEITRFKKELLKRISKIPLEEDKKVPRVGIIGEIFTVCDSGVNFEIEKKLGREGIEVHREMDLTYHLKKRLFPWKDWQIQREIMPYLQSTVGGHGRDAVCEMLRYVKEGFDGVIQLLPMGCMPETTVRPILERIHLHSGIPFLSLSLDEQVAEAGINTRLEAFVDVVRNYYNRKHY